MKGKPEFLSKDFLEHLKSKGFTALGDIEKKCDCNWLNNERCPICNQEKTKNDLNNSITKLNI